MMRSVIVVVFRPEDAENDQDEADNVGVGLRATDKEKPDNQHQAAH